jgi:hypothetical protein
MRCPSCATEISDRASFCSGCGSPTVQQTFTSNATASRDHASSHNTPPPDRAGVKARLAKIGVGAVAAVVLAAGGYEIGNHHIASRAASNQPTVASGQPTASTPTVNPTDVAARMLKYIQNDGVGDRGTSVTCPSGIQQTAGTEFVCNVSGDGGYWNHVYAKVLNTQGQVTYEPCASDPDNGTITACSEVEQ